MKSVLFSFVLLAILAQSMNKLWIQLDFYWNQEEIAVTKCEQRFKAGATCGGCCQLRKKLNNVEKKNDQSPCKLKSAELQLFIENRTLSLINMSNTLLENTHRFCYLQKKEQSTIHPVFRPPIRIT
jgi:hypothetical protein